MMRLVDQVLTENWHPVPRICTIQDFLWQINFWQIDEVWEIYEDQNHHEEKMQF